MAIEPHIREQVRRRANFACEFCGISETDVGAELTIDHFCPSSKGGYDTLDNLLYSCVRCNQYKLDYWPAHPGEPMLWNPRLEPASAHFVELDDGTLHPLTETGIFTLHRLRLNRPPLVEHRLHKRQEQEKQRLLERYRALTQLLEQLLAQQASLVEEQHELLTEQRELLRRLLQE